MDCQSEAVRHGRQLIEDGQADFVRECLSKFGCKTFREIEEKDQAALLDLLAAQYRVVKCDSITFENQSETKARIASHLRKLATMIEGVTDDIGPEELGGLACSLRALCLDLPTIEGADLLDVVAAFDDGESEYEFGLAPEALTTTGLDSGKLDSMHWECPMERRLSILGLTQTIPRAQELFLRVQS